MPTCTTCSREIPVASAFCPACGSPNPERGGVSGESDGLLLQRRLQSALGDNFTVEGPLGEGGFAVVFAVYDRKLSRRIAVKVLRLELTASKASKQRFVREAESVARLNHPHILPIFFVGENQGLAYFGMPLVEGETLEARLRREGRLNEQEAARIAAEIADALAEAHAAGLVHRDVKPLNVMLHGARQRVLVADFGIAKAAAGSGEDKLTGTGIAIGSPHYMSPEQAAGEELVDHRSDIYSLGILLWQMLTGNLPFNAGGGGSQALLMQAVNREVPDVQKVRPDVSDAMAQIVRRCVAKKREDRFQSAVELAQALHAAAAGTLVATPRRRMSRKWFAAVAAVFAFGLFGGVYWLVKTTERAAARAAEVSPETAPAGTAAPASTAPVIAVLPFATVGAEDTAQFGRAAALMLGEALALRNGVGTVDGNGMLSRWISERRNTTQPLDSNARFAYTMGANQMVIGNYVESGRTFRLSVALYDTHDVTRLWTGEITGSTDSLFGLLDKLASRVALALCDQPDYNPAGICYDVPARPRAELAVTAESTRAPLAFFARVGETGEVEDVRLGRESGDAEATNRALELLRSSPFTPAKRAGRAVAAWTDVSVAVNAAAGKASVAAGCDDADFGARNPDRSCYDTRPAPRQALVLATPPGCGTAPTPVTVRVQIDDAGRVQGDPMMVAPSECPGFTAAARAFVMQMTFNPATKDGHAVKAWTQLLVQPAPSAGGRE